MSGKYYYKSGSSTIDLANALEPTAYTAADWCEYFKGESFQKPGGDAYTANLTIANYKYGSSATSLKGVQRGYFPTMTYKFSTSGISAGSMTQSNAFASFTTAGTYTLTRSDSQMTITLPGGSTTTIPAANFRTAVVPKEIIILLVAGGGGGGGIAYYKYAKNDYRVAGGAAGGGGGVIAARVQLNNSTTYKFVVGAAGTAGSSGASGGENDSTSGGGGGNTSFLAGSTTVFTAYGGGGGQGGRLDGSYGTGGNGGGTYVNSSSGVGIPGYKVCSGSGGNYHSNTNRTARSACTWQITPTETGCPLFTVIPARSSGDSSSHNYSPSIGAENASPRFGGGDSLYEGWYIYNNGNGGYSHNGFYAGGGGGASGISGTTTHVTQGGSGGVYLFY
jgi:hypothetical protein